MKNTIIIYTNIDDKEFYREHNPSYFPRNNEEINFSHTNEKLCRLNPEDRNKTMEVLNIKFMVPDVLIVKCCCLDDHLEG